MGASSFVAYVLAYFSQIWHGAYMWHLRRILVTGTYMAVVWYINVAFCFFFLICTMVLGLYIDYNHRTVGHMYAVWQEY